jgi:hypothetical protein
MLVFNKYFYEKEKSKLCFGDRVVILNDFFYQTGGSVHINNAISSGFSNGRFPRTGIRGGKGSNRWQLLFSMDRFEQTCDRKYI